MQLRVLGSVDVLDRDRVIAVPGARRRSVLATLALRPGEVISVDKIIDAVWDDAPPATARNTVQAHVAALRKVIGVPGILVNRSPGYVLSLPAPGTDLVSARTLLAQAERVGSPAERLRLLRRVLELWRGKALADVAESTYLTRHATALEELRTTTRESVLADQLRLGQHRSAIPDLKALRGSHPFRERPLQLLMTALYRDGRALEALEEHDAFQVLLKEEFGVAPAPRTSALRRRILQRDRALMVPPEQPGAGCARPTPIATASVNRSLGRLVGRSEELELAQTLLERSRLVTVVGMGGVGKTRLASEIVRSREALGVSAHVVDVTAAEPDRLARFVATALSVPQEPGVTVESALASVLGAGDHLLLLDNCDHAVAAVAALSVTLRDRVPNVRILVTSRERLRVDGEECLVLAPLPVPAPDAGDVTENPAVVLLADRARLADPAFELGPPNQQSLAQLCRDVGGLPLALEILGARLRAHTAAELAEGVGRRLLSWRCPGREVDDRHRSLGSLMEWTFGLLDGPEVDALERLSCLRGGAWLTEATTLCGSDAGSGEDLLVGLMDRALLVRTEVDGRTRVSLHSLIAAHARERLVASGREVEVREAHARWVEGLVEATAERWHGADEARLLRRRQLDHGNLQALLEWRRDHHPVRLAGLVPRLWWFWYRTGTAAEGRTWADVALRTGAPARVLAHVHAAAGYLAWLLDDYDDAQAHALAALATSGVESGVHGFAHGVLARALGDAGDFAAAATQARRGIEAYSHFGDRWGVAWSRRCLASALLYGGWVAESADACREARAEFAAIGDEWGVGGALDLASQIAERQGHSVLAHDLARDALGALRRCGDTSGERYALQHLADSSWQLGRLEESARFAEEGLEVAERHGYQVGALQAAYLLHDISEVRGDAVQADVWRSRAAQLAYVLGPAAELSLDIARRRRAAGVPQRVVAAGAPDYLSVSNVGTSGDGSR